MASTATSSHLPDLDEPLEQTAPTSGDPRYTPHLCGIRAEPLTPGSGLAIVAVLDSPAWGHDLV
jgi:hypothetical protein